MVPPSSGNRLKQEDIGDPTLQSMDQSRPQQVSQQDDDEKSEYDPLFDEEPDGDGDSRMQLNNQNKNPMKPNGLAPVAPSNPIPLEQRTPTGMGVAAAPNAPPVLDPVTYANFSPDILMTAAIDGQVMLWDRRVHSPGYGVGRLPMGEKTRPWCVSVSNHSSYERYL